jgi:hypothetical protein
MGRRVEQRAESTWKVHFRSVVRGAIDWKAHCLGTAQTPCGVEILRGSNQIKSITQQTRPVRVV